MKIELRNVKHAAFASEETDCFSATVYLDGKKCGEVSNQGFGGSNSYHPHDLYDTINVYAKTLPKYVCSFIDDETGKPALMEQDPDILIGDIFNRWLAEKDLKGILSKRIAFYKAGAKGIYQTKVLPKESIARLLVDEKYLAQQKQEGFTILNKLPFDEALTLYRGKA